MAHAKPAAAALALLCALTTSQTGANPAQTTRPGSVLRVTTSVPSMCSIASPTTFKQTREAASGDGRDVRLSCNNASPNLSFGAGFSCPETFSSDGEHDLIVRLRENGYAPPKAVVREGEDRECVVLRKSDDDSGTYVATVIL